MNKHVHEIVDRPRTAGYKAGGHGFKITSECSAAW